MYRMACLVALTVATTVGCNQKDKDDPGPIPISLPTETARPTTTLTAPAQPTLTAAPTAASGGGYSPDGLPTDIPASHSAVPSVAEWNGVPREINVARSTPLNCETKMLREWLRVSCRPKSNTGGTPTNVVHKLGPTDETYYYSKGGVASLVTPITRGKHAESIFSWTDKTQTLVIDWPHGAPRPVIKFAD
jgi:hypothetical protein